MTGTVVMAAAANIVTLAQFRTWIRYPADKTDQNPELQEVLDAAHSVVADKINGRLTDVDAPIPVPSNGRAIILPFAGFETVVSLTDPSGRVVDPAAVDIDTVAGIIRPDRPVPGLWLVEVEFAGSMAPLQLAIKIIAEHLWGIQRGAAESGERSYGYARRNDGQQVIAVGYAVPNRAAELLAPFTLAIGFA